MRRLLMLLIIGLLLTGCSSSSYDYYDPYEDYDGAEYFAEVAAEAMSEIEYDGYCQKIGATSETECLETFRDELIELAYDAIVAVDDGGAEYFADIAAEAMSEIEYDGYCQKIDSTNETECLETFRDELIGCAYDAITEY